VNCTLLVAEDDEADTFLLRRAFQQADMLEPVEFVRDGQEAIEFLQRQRQEPDDRLPGLIVLDLKMPRRSGLEVLQWVREQPVLRCVPAIIFSSSDRREDVERAYALGASGYLIKPPGIAERVEVARFFGTWLRLNQRPWASRQGFRSAQSAHLAHRFAEPPAN
jgi:CheY-like chemotaxis protein